MPIYEYRCTHCGHITEMICDIKKKPKWVECEECKERAIAVISNTSFRLKGSGWAREGYSKK